MPVRFNCPVCKKRLSVSRRRIGDRVECPSCSSPIEVPGAGMVSPPKVEFAEVKEPGKSPIPSEDEEPTARISPQVTDDLEETPFRQEFETPVRGLQLPEEFDFASLSEDAMPTVEDVPRSRPATPSREEAPPIQFRRAASEFEEMDLTPMVDVTFLLLIFFMITASFTLEKTIPTPVPDPNEQSAAQPIQQQDELLDKSILIGIEADNTITIDDEPLPNANQLEQRLVDLMIQEQKAEALVTVADLATQETVVYVLDTANDVGMEKIRLASAPSKAE